MQPTTRELVEKFGSHRLIVLDDYLPLSSFDKRFINKSKSIDNAPICQTVKSLIKQ